MPPRNDPSAAPVYALFYAQSPTKLPHCPPLPAFSPAPPFENPHLTPLGYSDCIVSGYHVDLHGLRGQRVQEWVAGEGRGGWPCLTCSLLRAQESYKGPTLNRTETLLGKCDREEGPRGPPFREMKGPSHGQFRKDLGERTASGQCCLAFAFTLMPIIRAPGIQTEETENKQRKERT